MRLAPFDVDGTLTSTRVLEGELVIAVASARYSINDLAAHNPDLLVPDLKQTASIVSFIRTARLT